jgi:hypothetical protein
MRNAGHPNLDAGCWMLDAGCWMLDATKCSVPFRNCLGLGWRIEYPVSRIEYLEDGISEIRNPKSISEGDGFHFDLNAERERDDLYGGACRWV